MSASKLELENFDKFEGEINKKLNIYEFPLLKEIDQNKNEKFWQIFIRLVKTPKTFINKINTNIMNNKEKTIPMIKKYLKKCVRLPNKTVAQYWAQYGIKNGKITTTSPTYITDIKNEEKANERNQLQSALIACRRLWLKQVEKGKRTKLNDGEANVLSEYEHLYFPMLAHDYKKHSSEIQFPCYVQPKLDGLRCIAFLNLKEKPLKEATADDVICYTRGKKKLLGASFLREQLLYILKKLYKTSKKSIYLDGELYSHGMSLQKINSIKREDENKMGNKVKKIKLNLFDCFYVNKNNPQVPYKETYDKRLQHLERANIFIKKKKFQNIKIVEVFNAKNEKDIKKLYKVYLKKGYEGVMIKNIKSYYKGHLTKKSDALIRSKDVLKYKPIFTSEYKVIGYSSGNGRYRGAIKWICETNKKLAFNVEPKNISIKARRKLFKMAEDDFDGNFLGRLMTLEYRGLSDDGKPLMAKGLGFEDELK